MFWRGEGRKEGIAPIHYAGGTWNGHSASRNNTFLICRGLKWLAAEVCLLYCDVEFERKITTGTGRMNDLLVVHFWGIGGRGDSQ